jgi:hypothetical protein
VPERESGKKRVDFNLPERSVEQADLIGDLLGVSRTQLVVEALRDEIGEIARDADFRASVKAAYYDGEIGFDAVEAVPGTEDASRLRLLREPIDREPSAPNVGGDLPDAEEFYTETPSTWTPSGDDDAGLESS